MYSFFNDGTVPTSTIRLVHIKTCGVCCPVYDDIRIENPRNGLVSNSDFSLSLSGPNDDIATYITPNTVIVLISRPTPDGNYKCVE